MKLVNSQLLVRRSEVPDKGKSHIYISNMRCDVYCNSYCATTVNEWFSTSFRTFIQTHRLRTKMLWCLLELWTSGKLNWHKIDLRFEHVTVRHRNLYFDATARRFRQGILMSWHVQEWIKQRRLFNASFSVILGRCLACKSSVARCSSYNPN
jgi:hypothetical protein